MVSYAGNTYYGLSTDNKSSITMGVANGTLFLEMDTGNVFIFDAENSVWRQL